MKSKTIFLTGILVFRISLLFAAYGPTGSTGGNPLSLVFMLISFLGTIFVFIYLLFILPKKRVTRGIVSLPVQKIRIAFLLLFCAGGVGLLSNLFPVLFGNKGLVNFLGIGMGIGYLISGYFVMKKSSIALGIAIGLNVINTLVVQTYFPYFLSGKPIPGSFPLFIGLAIYLYFLGRAFDGIRELKQVNEQD